MSIEILKNLKDWESMTIVLWNKNKTKNKWVNSFLNRFNVNKLRNKIKEQNKQTDINDNPFYKYFIDNYNYLEDISVDIETQDLLLDVKNSVNIILNYKDFKKDLDLLLKKYNWDFTIISDKFKEEFLFLWLMVEYICKYWIEEDKKSLEEIINKFKKSKQSKYKFLWEYLNNLKNETKFLDEKFDFSVKQKKM